MAKLSDLELDPDLAEKGVWRDYRKGVRLRIARSSGPAFRAAVREAYRAIEEQTGGEDLTREQRVEALRRAMSAVVVRDWNVVDEKGEPDPYTPEKGYQALANPKLFHLYEWVAEQAGDLDNFEAVDEGNSVAGSTGSSDGVKPSQPSKSGSA